MLIFGQVFYTLFTQPAGSGGDTNSADFTQVKYGELAHTQIRRLVVVKNVPKEYFSFCLPITTYQGRGATKHGIDQRSHTIVFSGTYAPPKLPGEDKMNKVPLKVDLFSPSEKLDEKSRINLGKPYPIEWNVKVKEIGQLDKSSTQKMIAYWKDLTV
ncbi:MAG: hypothetical protein LQ351_002833 [Letrouitia transgressa]|nr:MAG: hypothetical protein LQ351_002833 [Letrouitia transgressa]